MKITQKQFGQYENRWVILDNLSEKVLDSDSNLVKLQKRLEKLSRKIEDITLFFVPSFHSYLAPRNAV